VRIGERVHYFLDKNGKSQAKLADYLKTSRSTINGWKQENRNPSVDLIVPICEFLEISISDLLYDKENSPKSIFRKHKKLKLKRSTITDKDISELIKVYGTLDHEGKSIVNATAYKELRRMRRIKRQENNSPIDDNVIYDMSREVPVYFHPAAAGTGTFLDSDYYDIVDFPIDDVPINTSFGVKVSGDSMHPRFADGDIVFVRQQPTLENGETGIFVLNGEAYIKKLSNCNSSATVKLISLNTKYDPIEIEETDSLRVVGKVIGTAKNW